MNKLEKYIKQKLQTRRLQPSDEVWNRIEAELDPVSKPSKVVKFHWYAIAAGLIVALVLSIAYFNGQPLKEQVPIKVVNTVIEKAVKPLETEEPLLNEGLKTEKLAEEQAQEIKSSPIDVLEADKEQIEMTVALAFEDDKKESLETPGNNTMAEEKLIDQKLNEVLTEVALLEEQNIKVTNAEIDSLLFAAQRELLTNKIFQENKSVDAMALLADVEDELDRTFRGHLFEKLKEGYFKVRTAVADRNN